MARPSPRARRTSTWPAVTLHVTYLAVASVRRLEVDVIPAVRVALETNGRPVQLVCRCEEDTTHDFYRPAGAAVMQASIDAQGVVTGLSITSAGDMITPRWIERGLPALAVPVDLPDKTASEGLFDLPYEIAHRASRTWPPARRAVGSGARWAFAHAFFAEGFIDELAFELKQDPVAYRLSC